jgi:hypothetical protein
MRDPKHIHPEDRARIDALNKGNKLVHGEPEKPADISYYSPDLIQTTLPHSDPKTNPWIRRNGNYTLIISSGFDSDGNPYGIPYGSLPRLALAYIITQVFHSKSRRVELGERFTVFLISKADWLQGKPSWQQRWRSRLTPICSGAA